MGVPETFHPTPVGVYFGKPGETVPDPYFGGAGPARTGCTECGACMTGCRVGAKNTLVKNYLYLAEQAGAKVLPLTTVTRCARSTAASRSTCGAPAALRAAAHRSPPARSCWPPVHGAPSGCCTACATPACCRGCPPGWAS